jgi:hypothetical protein
MLGSLARRERRAFWIVSSVLLAVGIVLALWAASGARAEAGAAAARSARVTAQATLAPLLEPEDLDAPIVGDRAETLGAAIERSITSVGPVSEVRIYSSGGRILYAPDPTIVGTRPSYVRDRVSDVASGSAQSWVRRGLLQTHVPIWLTPGGTVVVAEMSQPIGPIAAEANRPWHRTAVALAALLLGTLALAVTAARVPAPTPIPVKVSRPAPSPRVARERRPPAKAPLYEHPGFRRLEVRRQEAEDRARIAERNAQETQRRLRQALTRIQEMEEELAMSEIRTTHEDGELQALRDQLRATAERLHQVELENHELRERLSLRRQELDEARGAIAAGDEARELRERLDAAERRVAELTDTLGKVEAELDYTKSRFHLSMLTAALREYDNDDIQIEEADGRHDPVIVHRSPLQPAPARSGRVR